jgi:hypothetical protein
MNPREIELISPSAQFQQSFISSFPGHGNFRESQKE